MAEMELRPTRRRCFANSVRRRLSKCRTSQAYRQAFSEQARTDSVYRRVCEECLVRVCSPTARKSGTAPQKAHNRTQEAQKPSCASDVLLCAFCGPFPFSFHHVLKIL